MHSTGLLYRQSNIGSGSSSNRDVFVKEGWSSDRMTCDLIRVQAMTRVCSKSRSNPWHTISRLLVGSSEVRLWLPISFNSAFLYQPTRGSAGSINYSKSSGTCLWQFLQCGSGGLLFIITCSWLFVEFSSWCSQLYLTVRTGLKVAIDVCKDVGCTVIEIMDIN